MAYEPDGYDPDPLDFDSTEESEPKRGRARDSARLGANTMLNDFAVSEGSD